MFCENCYSGADDNYRPDVGWGDTITEALDDYRDSCELHGRPGPVSVQALEEEHAEGEAMLEELKTC